MSGSLQDQLLRAGLVTKDQANRAKAKVRKKAKAKQKAKAPEVDQEALQRQQELEQKKAKDRALNRERDAMVEKRAIQAQVRDILRRKRQNKPRADLIYNFVVGKVIKQVSVNEEQNEQLAAGRLGIAVFDQRHHIITLETVTSLRKIDSKLTIVVQESRQETPAEDDPYADYQVPDDLTW